MFLACHAYRMRFMEVLRIQAKCLSDRPLCPLAASPALVDLGTRSRCRLYSPSTRRLWFSPISSAMLVRDSCHETPRTGRCASLNSVRVRERGSPLCTATSGPRNPLLLALHHRYFPTGDERRTRNPYKPSE